MAWLTGWPYRKKITVQGTYLDSNQTWFPVYVYLNPASSGANLASKIRNDGYDIRFTKSDGETLLYYEREYYNESGGNSEGCFWVSKSDWTINADGSTDLYMYYGKSDATDGDDGGNGNVWDNDFIMVQHMHQTPYTALDDSTSNNNDVDTQVGDPTFEQAGKVHYGVTFDGDDSVSVPDSVTLDIDNDVTIEVWFKTVSGATMRLVGKSAYEYELAIGDDDVGGELKAWYGDGTNWEDLSQSTAVTLDDGNWHYYVWAINKDAGSGEAFIDGASEGSDTDTARSGSGTKILEIARYFEGSYYFTGTLDEIRISKTLRTTDWIKFTHANINESDQELSWTGEETSDININVIEVE